MPQRQENKPLRKKTTESGDQLEVRHSVDPPPIQETVEKVTQALEQAQKAKAQKAKAQKAKKERRHLCAVCGKPGCDHFLRIDLDTGEEFIIPGGPNRGPK